MNLCYILVALLIGVYRECNAGPQPAPFAKKITVIASGGGDYRTISDAINNGVPSSNTNWTHIMIKAGTYNEMVIINKPYVFLEGEGADKTVIAYSTFTDLSMAPLHVITNNFVAKGITFKNTYNHYIFPEENPLKQAVAAAMQGDMISFYECNFLSVQDTIFDASGRHYFKNCYIEGRVDFICGNGQSVYESCTINVIQPDLFHPSQSKKQSGGYITAQHRDNANESSGFIFKYCKITGTGSPYLGRAWGPFSRVIFYKSEFECDINPAGWNIWLQFGHEKDIEYSEVDCSGPGSGTSKRVGWEKKLTPQAIDFYTGVGFNNQEYWIQKQPKPLY